MSGVPEIYNGPHRGQPLTTLTAHDGSLVDIYEPIDLFGAIDRLTGSMPRPPVLSMGFLDYDTEVYQVTNADLSTTAHPLIHLRYTASADGLNTELAHLFEQEVANYNQRLQTIKEMALALWPSLVKPLPK